MVRGGWNAKDRGIASALEHAREKRMCLAAQTKLGLELLERRARAGELVCVFPHVYEEPSYWRSRELTIPEKALRVMRTAAVLHPEWVFCQTSAALAYGLEVSQLNPSVVHIVTSPRAHSRSTRNVIRHSMSGYEVDRANGVRVVDKKSCIIGCLRTLDLPHGLAVADSYLRKDRVDQLDLIGLAEGVAQRQQRLVALRTAELADERAENGGESVARGTMIELGYQVPDLQVEVENPVDLGHVFRVDFLWRYDVERPVIGELDGLQKYQDEKMLAGRSGIRALSDERIRESRLTVANASVMRFHFDDVLNRPRFSQLLDAFGVPKAG